VAEGSVVFKDERASLDLFGPFCGNGKKDIEKRDIMPIFDQLKKLKKWA